MALSNTPLRPRLFIQWKRLPFNDLLLPTYQTYGAAGFDLQACFIKSEEDLALYNRDPHLLDLTLDAQSKALIHTRFEIAIPENHVLLVCPRSGLATKSEIIILNSPGIVDEDYRGELIVGLKNIGTESLVIHHGMRIAQAVLMPVVHAQNIEVETLSETARGKGGFGSTGV